MDKQLKRDYDTCESVIKKHSKSFYKAFSMLKDENQRKAIYAVYAYCRYSDDVADELSSQEALSALKTKLDLFVDKQQADDYIFRALSDVRKKYYPRDFDFKPYYEMLSGHQMDLDHTTYKTVEDLEVYCKKVASSVGEMLIYILSPQGDLTTLKQVANDLGIAMQITNILRDIGEDYKHGRIYLPSDVMHHVGLTKTMIENKEINDSFIKTFNHLAHLSYTYYDKAWQGLDAFPKDARKVLRYALVIYREIIKTCIDNGYDVFTKKQRVSDLDKIRLIKEVDNNE